MAVALVAVLGGCGGADGSARARASPPRAPAAPLASRPPAKPSPVVASPPVAREASPASRELAQLEAEVAGAQDAPSVSPSDAEAGGLSVSRLLVATEVDSREPVDPASEFSVTTTPRLLAFVELDNPEQREDEVRVSWLDLASGDEHRPYALRVGPHKRFRTWARAAAPGEPGRWALLVRDSAGTLLARETFAMVD